MLAPAPQPTSGAPPPPPPPPPPGTPDIPPEIQTILNSPSQEDIIQLLRDDQVRSYRVDIETDSTIEADEQADQQRRTEFITAVGGFVQQALPVVSQVPEMMPMVGEMLLFLVRGFAAGRQLEDVIESAVKQIEDKAKLSLTQPPQDPPEVAIQKAKIAADQQTQAAKIAADQQAQQAKIAADQQAEAIRAAAEQKKAQADQEIEDDKAAAVHAQGQAEFDAKQAQTHRELTLKEKAHDLEERKHALALDQHNFTMDQAAKQHGLAAAAHNKQLVEEPVGDGENGDGEDAVQGPLTGITGGLTQLATALAQMQQQIMAGFKESREEMTAIAAAQMQALEEQQAMDEQIAALLKAPKRIVRGADGRATGVETVMH